jgi:hypothetical protein
VTISYLIVLPIFIFLPGGALFSFHSEFAGPVQTGPRLRRSYNISCTRLTFVRNICYLCLQIKKKAYGYDCYEKAIEGSLALGANRSIADCVGRFDCFPDQDKKRDVLNRSREPSSGWIQIFLYLGVPDMCRKDFQTLGSTAHVL